MFAGRSGISLRRVSLHASLLQVMGFLVVGVMLASCASPTGTGQPTQASYDGETIDYGLEPSSAIRFRSEGYDAPTPTRIAGATTVTTAELYTMLRALPPPVMIDVIGGSPTVSLPGAIWIPGAGLGESLQDGVQTRLATKLAAVTQGQKNRALVFFCLSKVCWLSHNAAVRAVSLGYTNVYWYRGGRSAWEAAHLPMQPVTAAIW